MSWRSKKQTTVGLSTAEAEYVALASAAQEAVWMKQLTPELYREPTTEPTVVFKDNQAAIAMMKNPQFHGRSKHISIKYHFVRHKVNDGTINISYCPTTERIADMLTKGLPTGTFNKLCKMIGLEVCSGSE